MIKHPLLEDKAWLYDEYWIKWRSTQDIGDDIGCSNFTVIRRMRSLGIEIKPSGGRCKRGIPPKPLDIPHKARGNYFGGGKTHPELKKAQQEHFSKHKKCYMKMARAMFRGEMPEMRCTE